MRGSKATRRAARQERTIRPEDVYGWPDEVQARLGVGRSVYELVKRGGLAVRAFGKRRFVLGAQLIRAMEVCYEAGGEMDSVRGVVREAGSAGAQAPSEAAQERSSDRSIT